MTDGSWDRAARGYGRQEGLERRAISRALDLLAPRPEEALLDVATGTGLVLRALAERPAAPARAVGLDASAAMLERVGPLPAGWSTVEADATRMPFTDGAFDLVTAAYVLHVLEPEQRVAALAGVRRVLRPGGRLVVVTVWTRRRAGGALLSALARAAPATLGGLRPFDARPELARAGWIVEHASAVHGGYPSLVVLARRR